MKNSARTTLFLASVVLFSSVSFQSHAAITGNAHSHSAQAKHLVVASDSDPRPQSTTVASISGSDPRPKGTVVA